MDEKRRKALAAALGLPEDATTEQISAASIQAGNDLQGVEGGEPDNAGLRGDEVTPEQQPPGHQTPPGTAPSGTAHNLSEEQVQNDLERSTENQPDTEAGVVRVDRKVWEETQAGAALAHKHEQDRISARRQEKVTAAIKAGKIPPSRRKHYESLMAMDEEGTTNLFNDLQASAVPLREEIGGVGDGEEITAGQAQGLPDEWFPDIAAKRARVAAGTVPVVTHAKEG